MSLAANSEVSNELWQSALDTFERTFSKPVFEMWIKPMRFISFHGTELHLAVHSKFARDWVGTKLRGQMIDVLSELFGTPVELRLSVAEANDTARGGSVFAPRPLEDFRTANLNVRYTFEEFVVGNSSRFAHAACRAVAERARQGVQPAVPVRRRRSRQDASHACDRPRACARRIVTRRSSTSRPRSSSTRWSRHRREPPAGVPRCGIARSRRAAHRRHPVPRRQGPHA